MLYKFCVLFWVMSGFGAGILCTDPFGISFDTTTPTFTFQGLPMMSNAQKLGKTLWFYCGRNQFILVVLL